MGAPRTLLLSSGGLRSLVATALARAEPSRQRLSLVHVLDGRDNTRIRLSHTQRQAEHYHAGAVIELDLSHLYGHGHGKHPDARPLGMLSLPQVMLATLAHAWLVQAERVIWPGSCGGEAGAMARRTEQLELCDHLMELENEPRPRIETPLLELTDQQIVELGAQLEVDWTQAWSCLLAGEGPCHACPGCRRRKAAFDKAALVDPIDQQQPVR